MPKHIISVFHYICLHECVLLRVYLSEYYHNLLRHFMTSRLDLGWTREDRRSGRSTHTEVGWKDILSVRRINDDIGFVFTLLVVLSDPLVYPRTNI